MARGRKKKPGRKKTKSKAVAGKKKLGDSEKRQIVLVKEIVVYIAGGNSEELVNLLYGTENVNEFLIAKKLKITINQARNILYKLAEKGLVNFNRKKDKKNGGWYTYFWTLDVEKSLSLLKLKSENEIRHFENLSDVKNKVQFYYCPECHVEMSEEMALQQDFMCPECGEVMHLKDNTGLVKEIGDKVVGLRKKLEIVGVELQEIEKRMEAKRLRRKKSDDKKKKAERDKRRKERALLKKKEEEKLGKKPVKKKLKKVKKKKTVKKKKKTSGKRTKKK